MIIKESIAGATGLTLSVIIAGIETIQNSYPHLMTTMPELAYSAVGGAIGGLLLMRAVRPTDAIDGAITLILSTIVGLAFGPSLVHYLQIRFEFFAAGDALTNIPAGALFGVFVPLLFPIFASAISSAKSNPKSVGDWVGKAVKAFVGQIRR